VPGSKYNFVAKGIEIEGGKNSGVDVQYPWETYATRPGRKDDPNGGACLPLSRDVDLASLDFVGFKASGTGLTTFSRSWSARARTLTWPPSTWN